MLKKRKAIPYRDIVSLEETTGGFFRRNVKGLKITYKKEEDGDKTKVRRSDSHFVCCEPRVRPSSRFLHL